METKRRTPIIQFGTSRFLQAHADLFVDEALAVGKAVGPIAVVQTSGDPSRVARLSALAKPEGFPVRIRGLENGMIRDSSQQVCSVRRALSTESNWNELRNLFCNEAEFVLSNTGDKGFNPQSTDQYSAFAQAMSYPAKLQLLLRARFQANARPLTIFPMELIVRNGDVLKKRVLELAVKAPHDYQNWLANEVIWANSLVDRIVSEPILPAGAVAEPYALWAIEAAAGLKAPCEHISIRMVEDLDLIASLKLFILNLGHTWLASVWQKMGQTPETVAALLDNEEVRARLLNLYQKEVLPAFEVAGFRAEAQNYIATTMERYRNPFLDHRLIDIAQNHDEKVDRRIGAFLEWARSKNDFQDKPELNVLLRGNESHV